MKICGYKKINSKIKEDIKKLVSSFLKLNLKGGGILYDETRRVKRKIR